MSSPMPERPSPPANKRASWLSIFLVLALCLVGALLLLVLPTVFLGPLIVIGGFIFFAVIGFHYLVWGRWLGRILREEQDEDSGGSGT